MIDFRNTLIFPRPIYAHEWEKIIGLIVKERDFKKLYVAAMWCAKECSYRAEDWGGVKRRWSMRGILGSRRATRLAGVVITQWIWGATGRTI